VNFKEVLKNCNMERDKVKALVIEKIGEVKNSFFEGELEKINEENLFYDLQLDSLDAVELIMKLENEFGIGIPDEDAEDLENKTIGDIINYIYEQLKNYDANNLYI
jgi:acyl carrier protein